MTVAGTALDSLSSTTDSGSPYAVAAPSTPTAGRVVAAMVVNTVAGGTAPEPTFAGYGATWVKVDTQTLNTTLRRVTLYLGFAASYSNAAPTATITGTPTSCIIKTAELTNVDTTTHFLQSNVAAGTSTTAATTLTTPTKACILAIGHSDNSNPTVEAGGNWASLGAGNQTVPNNGGLLAFAPAADDTPSGGTANSAWGIVAAELNETAGTAVTQSQLESTNRGVDRGVSRGVSR